MPRCASLSASALLLASTAISACAHPRIDPPATNLLGVGERVTISFVSRGRQPHRNPFSNIASPCFPAVPLVEYSALFYGLEEEPSPGDDATEPRRRPIARELLDPDNPDEDPPWMHTQARARVHSLTGSGPDAIDVAVLRARLDLHRGALGRCYDLDSVGLSSWRPSIRLRYDSRGVLGEMIVQGSIHPTVRACIQDALDAAVSPIATPSLSVQVSLRIVHWMAYELE